MAPSLVTCPTRMTAVPLRLAKVVSSCAQARTWLTEPAWSVSSMCTAAIAAGSAAAGEVAVDETALANLVTQDCGSCHGMTMKGGLGVPLLPATLKGKDDEALTAMILDGVPETPMPPWRGQLTETEAAWLVQQLKKGVSK